MKWRELLTAEWQTICSVLSDAFIATEGDVLTVQFQNIARDNFSNKRETILGPLLVETEEGIRELKSYCMNDHDLFTFHI